MKLWAIFISIAILHLKPIESAGAIVSTIASLVPTVIDIVGTIAGNSKKKKEEKAAAEKAAREQADALKEEERVAAEAELEAKSAQLATMANQNQQQPNINRQQGINHYQHHPQQDINHHEIPFRTGERRIEGRTDGGSRDGCKQSVKISLSPPWPSRDPPPTQPSLSEITNGIKEGELMRMIKQ